MTLVIGTAGHIDHGKTTLLHALTGIDADRLPEERARGMTIDVGYAHLTLADGRELDFVDVPGHDKLVGNMLVGAGEIDAALLVVAADDGPRAQTIEHLELLDALRIDDGLIVVTKTDAVSPDRVAEVVAAVHTLAASTSLAGVTVLPVAAATGDGLEGVIAALTGLADRAGFAGGGAASSIDGSRLAIDRVFAIRGRGTVVTGTLRGGPIERGAGLRVVPGPIGRSVRVREVQVHGRTVDAAGPGRVALNVAGEGVTGLERGSVLTTDPAVMASDRLLVALRPVVRLAGPTSAANLREGLPADRTRVAVHLGTERVSGVVGRSGRDGVPLDGDEGAAILRLDRPIAVGPGDRFVLRRPSPAATLAGGRVLDAEPARGVARRRATPQRLLALAAAVPGSAAWAAARLDLHGAIVGAPSRVATDVAASIDGTILALVDHRPGIGSAELVRAAAVEFRRHVGRLGPGGQPGSDADSGRSVAGFRLDALVRAGRITRDGDGLRPAGLAVAGPSAELEAAMERLVAALSTATPPPLALAARESGCTTEGIRLLERASRIVRLDDDLAWAFPVYRDLAARAVAMATGGPLTPAAYRDATGTSRKYVMAILEDLDRRAILRRTPDGHVPGPRAPRPGSAAS